jgi:outer membrane protein assembly factor BamB
MKQQLLALWIVCIACSVGRIARGDDWPQWMGPQRDGVWRETGIIEKFPAGGPRIRWRVPVSAGYSSPTVAQGKVFIHDRQVRRDASGSSDAAQRSGTPGVERVLCLDEATGKTLWVQEYACDYHMGYNAGPRAAPLVDGDRVYTFGAQADLQCRQVADGKLLWQKNLSAGRTPTWGFASSPLIEGETIIAVGDDPGGVLVALNKRTGEVFWQAIPAKEPGYSSPVAIEAGGQRQLIFWSAQSLNSLDPRTGQRYWSEPFSSKVGMSIATPRRVGDLLLVSAFYDGAMIMRLDPSKPTATRLWKIGGANERNTAALHTVIGTPVIKDDYIYGVCSYGQLRCLKAQSGQRVWETMAATTDKPARWANVFINQQGERYFLFNEKGDLIIATLSPEGYHEISRAHLIDPTNTDPGRSVVWCQPAYANRCIYVRSDKELLCASLAEDR